VETGFGKETGFARAVRIGGSIGDQLRSRGFVQDLRSIPEIKAKRSGSFRRYLLKDSLSVEIALILTGIGDSHASSNVNDSFI
jgi:hypothetical protein